MHYNGCDLKCRRTVGWKAVVKKVIKELIQPNQSFTSGDINSQHDLIRLQPCVPTMPAKLMDNSLSPLAANLMDTDTRCPNKCLVVIGDCRLKAWKDAADKSRRPFSALCIVHELDSNKRSAFINFFAKFQ